MSGFTSGVAGAQPQQQVCTRRLYSHGKNGTARTRTNTHAFIAYSCATSKASPRLAQVTRWSWSVISSRCFLQRSVLGAADRGLIVPGAVKKEHAGALDLDPSCVARYEEK